MHALVVGATGQTGRHIVRELLKKNIPVKAFVRDLEKARKILPSEAQLVLGDVLDKASIASAITDCDILVCATGASPSFNIIAPYQIDYEGTKNLVDVATANNIRHFVIVSSLCVSQFFHPLNLFWLVLYWKKQAEQYIQKSGLTYTIVRPGGLKNEDNTDNTIMSSADTLFEGSIPRQKVSQVCVEALFNDEAKNKIVEIIAKLDAPKLPWNELFARIT